MALSIGVSYELFWHLNPRKLEPFIQAHSMRKQEESAAMWLMGQYVAAAMDATVCNMMPFVKRNKRGEYPEKPIRVTPMTEEEKKAAEEAELMKFLGLAGALEVKTENKGK